MIKEDLETTKVLKDKKGFYIKHKGWIYRPDPAYRKDTPQHALARSSQRDLELDELWLQEAMEEINQYMSLLKKVEITEPNEYGIGVQFRLGRDDAVTYNFSSDNLKDIKPRYSYHMNVVKNGGNRRVVYERDFDNIQQISKWMASETARGFIEGNTSFEFIKKMVN